MHPLLAAKIAEATLAKRYDIMGRRVKPLRNAIQDGADDRAQSRLLRGAVVRQSRTSLSVRRGRAALLAGVLAAEAAGAATGAIHHYQRWAPVREATREIRDFNNDREQRMDRLIEQHRALRRQLDQQRAQLSPVNKRRRRI